MPSSCPNPATCACAATSRDFRIAAHNNAIGPRIVDYVPEFRTISHAASELNFGYCAANDDRDPIGSAVRKAIADLERVDAAEVRVTGSLLDFFAVAPQILDRHTTIKIASDFNGYLRGAGDGILALKVPIDIDAQDIDPLAVAEVVRGADAPLLSLTFPVTNPGQQAMSLKVAEAALAANDKAIVILDNAYRGVGEIEDLARFALSNQRTLYVNTASKDLYLCGARFGWAIASKSILEKLSTKLPPYGVGPLSLEQGRRILALPDALHSARRTQVMARDILTCGLRQLNVRMRTGLGTWVLLYFGSEAGEIVAQLADIHKIDIQLQGDDLKGWVRISATVPCEAYSIVNALTELQQVRRLRKLRQRLSEGIIADVNAVIEREFAAAWSLVKASNKFSVF